MKGMKGALAVKFAFIDSFILVRTMVAYMGVAPETVITLDIYGKQSGISSKFKELWGKGREEQGRREILRLLRRAHANVKLRGRKTPQTRAARLSSRRRVFLLTNCKHIGAGPNSRLKQSHNDKIE
jgi:hypothetical protein